MRIVVSALLIAAALPMAAHAQTPAAPAAKAPAVTPAYSTEETDIATLLANPATKTVLVKHIPAIANNDQISMAGAMTLRALQSYSPELNDELLAKIDIDLAKIPASTAAK